MNVQMYSIYDAQAHLFNHPNCFVNDASAMRAVFSFAMQPGSTVYEHPDDFSLFCIGSYDDNEGSVSGHAPRLVATISGLIARFNKSDK